MSSGPERPHWAPLPEEWQAPLPLTDAAARDSLQRIGWEALQVGAALPRPSSCAPKLTPQAG